MLALHFLGTFTARKYTWTDVDQQAVESLAKKWTVDLEAKEIAGTTATFAGIETVARQIEDGVTRMVCEGLPTRV